MKTGLKLGWTLAALLPLGFAGVVSAQMGPQDGGPGFGQHRPPMERAFGAPGGQGRWWNNPSMIEQLKLTDDQRKAMDQILLQHRETLIDLRGNVEKAELAMEPLMRDDQPNEGRILAQIDKVAQARAELEKGNARFLLAIRSKLTPDQWKLVQAERAKHHEGGWGGGERMHPGMHQDRQNGHQGPPPPGPQGALERGDGPESSAIGEME
jgi:Spy/CpxP family protein refolding chaperone